MALNARGSRADGYGHVDGESMVPTHVIPVRVAAAVVYDNLDQDELAVKRRDLRVAFDASRREFIAHVPDGAEVDLGCPDSSTRAAA